MKAKVVYILSIFCFCNCSLSSQPIVKSNILTMLSIADTSLIPILDSAISFEKKCTYYNDSLFFTIDVNQKQDVFELQIESSSNINRAQNYFEPILGYLYFKNHLFFVYNQVSKKFFSVLEETKEFKYVKYDESYQSEDTLILYHIIDDSHTYWNYYYINNKFVFDGKSSFCN